MRRSIIHRSVQLLLLALSLGPLIIGFNAASRAPAAARPVLPELMDYRDVAELTGALQNLADNSRHAQLFTIGHSIDYKTDPRLPRIYPIHAIRISASTDEAIWDDYRKNSVLFEAGMHPREWLPTESCLMLAEYLVEHAEDAQSHVPEMLSKVDVWIIPLSNPSGRAIDDTQGGDPRQFSTSPSSSGWRGNGDARACDRGVNVARNFSRGWNNAPADCAGDDPGNYRGFAPFSTQEATALRNFVQNHGISLAVVTHSTAEKIWNLWGDEDVAGRGISEMSELIWRILNLDDPNLALTRTGVGRGQGQFSAWLSGTSNTALEPDDDTVRGIQTIYIELPFLANNYKGDYRYRNNDGSNGFHPSGAHVRDLIRRNFIPMAKELIYQGRSPGCQTFGNFPWNSGCPGRDFGLVGAKIDRTALGAGWLRTNSAGCLGNVVNGQCDRAPVPARDYLPVGQYNLDYRVQNFGVAQRDDDVDVKLTLIRTIQRPDGSESRVSSAIQSFSNLSEQEVRTGRFALSIDTVGADYTVSLEVRPASGFSSGARDDFDLNDKKVFKFRVTQW